MALENEMIYVAHKALEAGLGDIRRSPKDNGILEMIVCRPASGERKILIEGELDLEQGLIGDCWRTRTMLAKTEVSMDLSRQVTVMNARALSLMARSRDRWPLAGDQLIVDFDLSDDNLKPGSRLSVGSAIIEVTDAPHNGCTKFRDRYGSEALKFVNSDLGKLLHLRGINARIIRPGKIKTGDRVTKTGSR